MFEAVLDTLKQKYLFRSLRTLQSAQGTHIVIDGKKVLNLCSNNYLGLANHPALKKAAAQAIRRYGTGAGASRLISGNNELYARLEKKVARYRGTEAALVFSSGYAANVGIISALAGRGDIVIGDKLNHASIIDGMLLSGAEISRYPHKDISAVETILKNSSSFKKKLLVTDSVFSMDGDIAPLEELAALAKKYGALFMVDDAHAVAKRAKRGQRPFLNNSRIEQKKGAVPFLIMGTFSKALGSYGAYVAGSRELIDFLINKARSLIYSTALPPAVLAANIAALELLEQEQGRVERLKENADFFKAHLRELGLDTGESQTQIIPIMVGDSKKALALSKKLFDKGVYLHAIRPPTVPQGTARLRASIMATHTKEDLSKAIELLAQLVPGTKRPFCAWHQEG